MHYALCQRSGCCLVRCRLRHYFSDYFFDKLIISHDLLDQMFCIVNCVKLFLTPDTYVVGRTWNVPPRRIPSHRVWIFSRKSTGSELFCGWWLLVRWWATFLCYLLRLCPAPRLRWRSLSFSYAIWVSRPCLSRFVPLWLPLHEMSGPSQQCSTLSGRHKPFLLALCYILAGVLNFSTLCGTENYYLSGQTCASWKNILRLS